MTSTGGFSSGLVTVATHDIQTDYEKLGTLETNIGKSNNQRMIQQLDFHKHQSIRTTSVQDLDPRSYADNDHESVLSHEMTVIEPVENPSRTLTRKPLVFLSHMKCRTVMYDRLFVSQWESFSFSIFGVSTSALIGPVQQCVYNAFSYGTCSLAKTSKSG